MESKAYHIAATIVAVHHSKYHRLRGVIDLSSQFDKYEHVVFDQERSRRSASNEDGPREQDPEVLRERAIIDLSGHEAEEIYHIVNHLPLDGRRMGDHDSILDDAMSGVGDLDVSRSELVQHTLELVSRNWFAVRDLARLMMLSEDRSLDSQAAMQRLTNLIGTPSNMG